MFRHRLFRWVSAGTVAVSVVVFAVSGTMPAAAAAPAPPPRPDPGPAVRQVSAVPAHFAPARDTSVPYRPTAVNWPAPGTGTAAGTPAAKAGAAITHAGTTPVWQQGGAAPVGVRLLDHAAALASGVSGVLFTATGAGSTRVGLDYSGFAQAYGGNYGSRLRLERLPACALTTPARAACQRGVPLPSVNDQAHQRVSALVALGGTPVVLAATGTPGQDGGAAGNYAATTLKPAGSWTTGGSNGSFTYDYPIAVPPAASALVPQVALGYDSTDIDGQTAMTAAQSSWAGDGWGTPDSFIEQTFVSCSDSPQGSAAPESTSDLCYDGPVLSISLAGSTGALVRDGATGVWKTQRDNGDVIAHVTNSGNGSGTKNTDYWTMTTRGGTTYYFGRNQLPGWATGKPTTNSVDYEPVYSAHNTSDAPCFSAAGFAASVCTLAYRWHLDYVTDVHGNAMAYYYHQDVNFYGQHNGDSNAKYVRSSVLDHVDYGFTAGNAFGTAPDRVKFQTAQRCLANCDPLDAGHKANWPDVPFDLICAQGATCPTRSPSFFATSRLSAILTQQYDGTGYATVDTYALNQTLPSTTDLTSPTLWLNSITHTGSGGGSVIALPPVSFTPLALPNRVDTVTDGLPPLYRNRIQTVTTETGAVITPTYSLPRPCTAPVTTDPAANSSSCYPVYWTPDGASAPLRDWFDRYAVTKVTTTDPTGGSPASTVSYSYGPTGWHFDNNEVVKAKYRTYGQFHGYASVATRTGDGVNDPRTLTVTDYYRGMSKNNNTTVVNVTDSAGGVHEDLPQLAGSTSESTAYLGDGGPVDHRTVTAYWVSPATASRSRTGLPVLTANRAEVALTDTRQAVTSSGATTWRENETDTSYDANPSDAAFGLVTHTYAHTVPAAPGYDRCTSLDYAKPNTAANLVGLVARAETDSVACGGFTQGTPASVPHALNTLTAPTAVNRPDQVVSDRQTFYDDPAFGTTFPQAAAPTRGDATMVRAATGYVAGAGVYQTSARTVYDGPGRITASYDGNGNRTSTAYATNASGLPTGSTVTNALGQHASATVDPRRGLTTSSADRNGVTTTSQYDALGRVTGVWLAGRSTTLPASYTYAYTVSRTGPTAVTTNTLNDESGYRTSTAILDAQDRTRQTQTMTPQGGRRITDTIYDSHGWVVQTNSGWWDPASTPDTTLVAPTAVTPAAPVPDQDVLSHDGLGRVVQDRSENAGRVVSTTTTVYGGDRTTTIAPAGGITQTTLTDPLGRTAELDQYTEAPALMIPTNTFTGLWNLSGGSITATAYGYDRHGNQATVTDAAGSVWTATYDLLGRLVGFDDPDTGAGTARYDAAGNQVETTDGRGRKVSYTYDALNRKTGSYAAAVEAQAPGNQLTGLVYDNANGAVDGMADPLGQLTTATAYRDGAAYVRQQLGFTAFGASTGEKVTVPDAEGALAGTYQFGHTYSGTTGLLAKDSYPAAGGLPAETVTHAYAGVLDLPDTLAGLAGYAQGVTYDAFGRVNQETIGAGTNLAYLTDSYDPHTGHLTDQLLTRQVATPANVDEEAYSYDQAGNITRQDSTRFGAATPAETQCARYDQLDRLTMAWTATDSCAAVPGAGGSATVGDGLGPASAYWTQWSYDAVGDRTAQTEHPGGAAAGTTTTYTYGTAGGAQPHTLTSTSAGGTYGYDAAGDTTSRNGQALTWNDARQLVAVGNGSSYVYDGGGVLLLQKDPDSTTLYLPGEQLVLAGGTTSGTRYYPLPGGGTAIRTGAARASYQFELTDQHGTPTVYLDSTAQQPSWRQSTPYGQPRGAAVTAPDNHGFLGKPTDAGTGLVFVGAREYDPATGRFISPDPVFEADDPQSLNGYGYAAGNPVTRSDPSGLRPCGDVGCDGYQANGNPVVPSKKESYTAPSGPKQSKAQSFGDRCGVCGNHRYRQTGPKGPGPRRWHPGDDAASSRNCMAWPFGSAFSSPGACDEAYAAADQIYQNELAMQAFGYKSCATPSDPGTWLKPCHPKYPDVTQVAPGTNTPPPPADGPGSTQQQSAPSTKDGGWSFSVCGGASAAAFIFAAVAQCYGVDKNGVGQQDSIGVGWGQSITAALTGGFSVADGSLKDVAGWDACAEAGGEVLGADLGEGICTNGQTTSASVTTGVAVGGGANFGSSVVYTTAPTYFFHW